MQTLRKNRKTIKELSLFSGAGGGLLATKHLLGWETIGYVEKEEYCQKVIAQRIKDGLLDEAPIFGDIRAFNREGYAESYKGMVDVITGGFPCQDISCAGKGAGIKGSRSGLWFEMVETIRTVGPSYVFIENVPAILVRGFEHVLGTLTEMGYDARWGIVSAADVGAPHLRKRIWIVANTATRRYGNKKEKICPGRNAAEFSGHENTNSNRSIGDEARITGKTLSRSQTIKRPGRLCDELSDPHKKRLQGWRKLGQPPPRWQTAAGIRQDLAGCGGIEWWELEPALGRVAYGVANRVDRLRAIGNGQVPLVAATAWNQLIGE